VNIQPKLKKRVKLPIFEITDIEPTRKAVQEESQKQQKPQKPQTERKESITKKRKIRIESADV